ncbi:MULTISPECIES: polysaccharide lyase family protein [Asticcacaulis]|uniref:polysaccharide lyase family protein n=1 Tax=Asticcacaulis TaxID=76890 RepID=UPI001AE64C3A|nr:MULTISPECIES: polysaccharide lyase family protein [Asticcacaulis]MBP2161477.1 rhamnogalacturonan endolyase [Asticcacaulis solisilvae]MDR6802522.1 rhamnogalacturonan endolyase [Asticcacaulis sp. BE141]
MTRLLRTLIVTLGLLFAAPMAFAQNAPVTVTEDRETFTLSNGIITAVISKRTSDLVSMKYKGFETLAHDTGGHSAVYWSHDVTGGQEIISTVTIDPNSNNGARAEVSVKGISGGIKMGHGPGTATDGDFPADIDIRYSLGQGESMIYTWCVFDHKPEYGAASMAEARIAGKLVKDFTWIHVDEQRSGIYPLMPKGSDKYAYTTVRAEQPAFGWSSPEKKIGWFLLNPSNEYLSSGPTRAEFLAHGEHPTILNYWRSSHYGGSFVSVKEGEQWSKVIGPFALYINEGETPEAMWSNARRQQKLEAAKWPYDWAKSPYYAPKSERGTVKGQFRLDGKTSLSGRLRVGLTRTPYDIQLPAGPREVDWDADAKYYQFWADIPNGGGAFDIKNVVPGTYTLYAFADDVFEDYVKADVTVKPGQALDLGTLAWKTVRYGKTAWEIGKLDRSGAEFNGGQRYFELAKQFIYAERFPDDVTFRIGRSREAADWYFAQMPHLDGKAEIVPISGLRGNGRDTPYHIDFVMDAAPKGKAMLRLAINATGGNNVELRPTVNGQVLAPAKLGPHDGALQRHQMHGRWYEVAVPIDAGLLRKGDNRITLTMPAGPLNNGVVYDYLRLEAD